MLFWHRHRFLIIVKIWFEWEGHGINQLSPIWICLGISPNLTQFCQISARWQFGEAGHLCAKVCKHIWIDKYSLLNKICKNRLDHVIFLVNKHFTSKHDSWVLFIAQKKYLIASAFCSINECIFFFFFFFMEYLQNYVWLIIYNCILIEIDLFLKNFSVHRFENLRKTVTFIFKSIAFMIYNYSSMVRFYHIFLMKTMMAKVSINVLN